MPSPSDLRNEKLSIFYAIKDFFDSPSWPSDVDVVAELPDVIAVLPTLVVGIQESPRQPLELGDSTFRNATTVVTVNCYARNHGEAEDLADTISEILESVLDWINYIKHPGQAGFDAVAQKIGTLTPRNVVVTILEVGDTSQSKVDRFRSQVTFELRRNRV